MDGLDSPSHLPVYSVNMDEIMPVAVGGRVTASKLTSSLSRRYELTAA